MAFNHFVRFLMEHEPEQRTKFTPAFGFGCVSIFVAFGFAPFSTPIAVSLIILGALGLCFPMAKDAWRSKKLAHSIPPELVETWQLLRWMGMRRELNRRTHPELRTLLEEISHIRRTTLDALGSKAWKSRAKTQEGAQAVKDIEAVLRDALYDAIFIGRHLFRVKGQRETTFAKRCADPKFGRHALESIGQIRDEMRLLSESALAASTQSDLRVNLVKQRLDALVDAERELESVSHFDATD